MQIEYIEIDRVIPYANNPRKNDGEAVDRVASSIKEYGFKNPIIVDKDNVIVAGHTRYKAAKKLRLDTVPIIKADDLTPAQIKAFRIADNKVAEYSSWDNELLSIEFEELQDLNFDLELIGFDMTEIEDMLAFDNVEENTKEKERNDLSDTLKENYELIVKCNDENELESIYEELVERGYVCQISTL